MTQAQAYAQALQTLDKIADIRDFVKANVSMPNLPAVVADKFQVSEETANNHVTYWILH